MNPGEFSVKNNRMVLMAMAMAIVGGIIAYLNIGRLEDPEFTIKQALIITPYPGASAEEVAQEVSNPIEIACQRLGQLDCVKSESSRGRSVVTVSIKARYDKDSIPQVWDELRRKVADVQSQLPPAVRGQSMVDRRFRRRVRHFPGGDRRGLFVPGAAPLRRVPAPRTPPGAGRQKRRALWRTAGSRLPRNLAATAGAVGPQRGADLQQTPGAEHRRRRGPHPRWRPAHSAGPDGRLRLGR